MGCTSRRRNRRERHAAEGGADEQGSRRGGRRRGSASCSDHFWTWSFWVVFPLYFWIWPAVRDDVPRIADGLQTVAVGAMKLSPAAAPAELIADAMNIGFVEAYGLLLFAVAVNVAVLVFALSAGRGAVNGRAYPLN